MTNIQLLLLPLFLHVLLITVVGISAVQARIRSVLGGETRMKDIALGTDAWPDKVRQLGNNFDNQFDVPMLWYACCALLLGTGLADWISVALSWLFLAARVAHAFIHTGSNYVPTRMRVFLAGFAIVFSMWAWFGLRLFVIG
jgi:hypothetical protein